jgi:hypothetical protein
MENLFHEDHRYDHRNTLRYHENLLMFPLEEQLPCSLLMQLIIFGVFGLRNEEPANRSDCDQ